MKKQLLFIVMLLLLSWQHAKAEKDPLIPNEFQWQLLGSEEEKNGGVALQQPATLSLAATGPFYAPANVVLVISISHPENITKIIFSDGTHLDYPVFREYELSLNDLAAGHYEVRANVEDLLGKVEAVSVEFDVFSEHRYDRASTAGLQSSIIAIDGEKGDFLDGIQDFSLFYGSTNYPWFLRSSSPPDGIVEHIEGFDEQGLSTYKIVNYPPVINGEIVGGAPPMVAFGSSTKQGSRLFINQDYHFGVITGFPSYNNGLKIDVYDKSDFGHGARNVVPAYSLTTNLPNLGDVTEMTQLTDHFGSVNYHLSTNVNGKQLDFETTIQYQFGDDSMTWGSTNLVIPLIVTHRSGNDFFYYEVSFQGTTPSPQGLPLYMGAKADPVTGLCWPSYNLTYALNFEEPASWSATVLNAPQFQNAFQFNSYAGKNIDQLIHHGAAVESTLAAPSADQCKKLTLLNSSPEFKMHSVLNELVDDLKGNPIAIANYVQNSIELTDAVGYNTNVPSDTISINSQGVMRDALGTYLEGQGSPIEQCGLLIYLLRKAGVPAGYIFPKQNEMLMFDEQLSNMLHMQLRGTANIFGQGAKIPELVPVNYPWVAAYVDGKWVHLFPWIKDTEVREGKDLWGYFPQDYKDGRAWLKHYLFKDTAIRLLSERDNVATLFPLYAEKQLQEKNLTLKDVGVEFNNRQNDYARWEDFPRPWSTPIVTDADLVDHLSDDFFDTINIQVFSDRNNNREPDSDEPILETGEMRFADLHDRRLLLYHQIVSNITPLQYQMILSLEAYDSTPGSQEQKEHTFAHGINPDPGDFTSAQKISTNLVTAVSPSDLNDDDLCYKITEAHHKQAANAHTDYWSQFPGLGEIDSIVDVRPLRKGDMVALSLDYGRITEEMKNFELKKYLDYQHTHELDPSLHADPEIATGQLLHLMGKTYYYHISDFQQKLENYTKTHAVSFRAHGLTKLSPQYGTYGPVTTTHDGAIDFNLCYPKVDMSFQRAVALGNATPHLESGANTETASASYALLIGEISAQEHCIINEFFDQTDAISTVKLLDLAQEGENGITVLGHSNLNIEKKNALRQYPAGNDLREFNALWSQIESFFKDNKDIFATVWMTSKPVTASKQQGTPYTGIGAFGISGTTSGAWITDRLNVANGAYGGCLNMPICSQHPEVDNAMLVSMPGGGFSFHQNPFAGISIFNNNNVIPEVSWDHFQNANQQVASGNQTLAPDIMGSLTMWSSAVHQGSGSRRVPPLSNTGTQTATLWKQEVDHGSLGAVSYYTPSPQAVKQGVWKLVHDPVNVITGEFYINALDLRLNGPMPLELRRLYGSQTGSNGNFGSGWKIGYFPYLLLSDDENETTPASLIYAAEQDGSVIAYRYQTESKSWMPAVADNPELVNNNDGTHLASANHFNNKIFKIDEHTYQLVSCDGTIRTFAVDSFPLTATPDVKRTRPYLQSWSDINGNKYEFHFGRNNTANDYGELNLITSSNGNSLRFRYDPYGHIIEAFASDGRHLKYRYDAFGDLVSVTLPDGSTINYQYQHSADETYSTHLLTQVIKPKGRIIKNDYDEQRRVTTQYATTGSSPKPTVAAQFTYNLELNDDDKTVNGKTTVTDALKHQTVYEIAKSQITAVHLPENRSITQKCVGGSLSSRTDRRGLVSTFDYDVKGNLISKTVSGNLTGQNNSSEKATTQFSYNDKNLLTAATDPLGCGVSYDYNDQSHPSSPTRITKMTDGKTSSATQLSYKNAGGACGLVASVNVDGALTSYDYDTRGFLSSITQKTGTADPDVVTKCTSNQRGEVIATFHGDGSQKKYSYDALGHCTGVETFGADGAEIDWHFNYYNQNGEIEWEQGARFNPVDYTYYDYDRAGNLLHKLAFLNAGLATTSYQYDEQGNCISIRDPNGNPTTMTYDGLGEMVSQKWSDGSEEKFSYELGGKIATHQTMLGGHENYTYTSTGLLQSVWQADGTGIQYHYDLSGRLIEENFSHGISCKISYHENSMTRNFYDASGKSLGSVSETYDARGNLLEKRDLAGNIWSYSYDALNRLKTKQGPPPVGESAEQGLKYFYRPGVVSTMNAAGESSNQFFDALNRPTMIKILNKDGSVAKTLSNQYSGDHQSVTTTVGSGSDAITTTTCTDSVEHLTMIRHADGSFKKFDYDANGNLISFTDEEGNKTGYTYDALNHLASEMRSDGDVIKYSCNPAGEVLFRSMPEGLVEKNEYDQAGEKISSSLLTSGGSMTRHYLYDYDQGLLVKVTDPRGGKIDIGYDAWMHPIEWNATGFGVPQQNQKTTCSYSEQGLLEKIAQEYQDPSTGPSTLVFRGYDAYGQLISETTSLNGTNIAAWNQAWDGAGRRTALNWNLDNNGKGGQYSFDYNALGLMTKAQNDSGTSSYFYGNHGLLLSQTTPAGQKNLQRDQQGRIIHETLSDGSQESLLWRSDGKIKSYSIVGNAANETRNYEYDALGRLVEEPYTLTESPDPNALSVGTHTAKYAFDQLGVRIKQEVTPEIKNTVIEKNNFSQVLVDDLNNLVNKTNPWTSSYDAAGAVTMRGINDAITQDLTWDSMGRLVEVNQRNKNDEGYNWKTIYDGLGRRVQTSYCDATGSQTTSQPLTITYYNDPEVEFLELGRDYFGRTWNLYGPDRSGLYGGAQGIGGLEATTGEGQHEVHGVVNNFFGDSIGITAGTVFQPWGNVLGGYGAMPGSSVNADLVPQWRDHYLDWTGFYYMGTRYYEPKSGRFLSPDPLGYDASLSLYGYCEGDPVNGLDPDGRCVEKCEQNAIALNNVRYQNTTLMNAMITSQRSTLTQLQGIGGELLSYFDGDLDDPSFLEARNQALQRVPNQEQVMSVNGILTGEKQARVNANRIARSLQMPDEAVLLINNYLSSWKDIPRALLEQLGCSDLRSLCLADIVNYNDGGKAIAFSNGSVVVANAAPYMTSTARAHFNYTGLNPQRYIGKNEFGFQHVTNTRNQCDLISILFPSNQFKKWDKTLKVDDCFFNVLRNHSFMENYLLLMQ